MINAFLDGLMLAAYLPGHWLLGTQLPQVPLPVTGFEHFCFGSGMIFCALLMLYMPSYVFRLMVLLMGMVGGAFFGVLGVVSGPNGEPQEAPEEWRKLPMWQRAYRGMCMGVVGFKEAYFPMPQPKPMSGPASTSPMGY